ncbi:MAG: HPF/RaiA family ribosome-associated protein [Candidatus Pacebacteria bacterium]|nr:HPF/RaiA family ribosome-associated protein [Candidatus Paceibacterota bacterium]
MEYKIKFTNIAPSDNLKKIVIKKTNWVERYLNIKDFSMIFNVEFEKLTTRQRKGKIFRVEFNLPLPGKTIRIERVTDDMIKSLDEAKDVLKEEIKIYKEKMKEKEEREFRELKRKQYNL